MAPNALLSQPPVKKVVCIAPDVEGFAKDIEKEKGFSLHPCNSAPTTQAFVSTF
jgi:hypothetical protein